MHLIDVFGQCVSVLHFEIVLNKKKQKEQKKISLKKKHISRPLQHIPFLLLMNASCLYAPLIAPTESKYMCLQTLPTISRSGSHVRKLTNPSLNFCKIYSLEALAHFHWLMFKCSIRRSCCKRMSLCAVSQ